MTATLFMALLVLGVLLVYLVIAVRTWAHVHGTRLVVCPETQLPVVVKVDVGHAMASAVWEKADLRVTTCSRWPERQDCDQPCVQQIESNPTLTEPKAIAARFFSRKRCAICMKPIEPPAAFTLQPGFMNPATRRVDPWDGIEPLELPRAMSTWRPLCANCTQAESFRQHFTDLATDRRAH